jgi:mono/diheme cytochrome c family protein
MRNAMQLLLIVLVLVASVACAASAPTPTPTPRPPPTQPPAPTQEPPAPSGPTVAQVAESGAAVYAQWCAACHGDRGQGVSGPALVGAGTNIQRHGDALGLLGYFSSRMPAGAPGSLSEEQYTQILAWILLGNGFVEPSAVWADLELSGISLAK